MTGDGLLLCSEGDVVPLDLASTVLRRALLAADGPPSVASEQPDGWRVLRAEVGVQVPTSGIAGVLDWLEAQSGRPRTLFANRDRSLIIAGTGAAHVHTAESCSDVVPDLGSQAHERICYLGGARFDSGDPDASFISAEWRAFGQFYWVLPRVELTVRADSWGRARTASNLQWENNSVETATTASDDSRSRGSRPRGSNIVLSVQMRWRGARAWLAERASALEALSRLRPSITKMSMKGLLSRRSESVSQDSFEGRVRDILSAIESDEVQKVVAARTVTMELAKEVDVVAILRHVAGKNLKRHYFFLLEPQVGSAFVSLTPERLCKVSGQDMWTEAVAGTWPIAEFEKIGEAALLRSSEKHNSEHQVVVDYVCGLLREVSHSIKVCDRHITKLKHLVHIKQTYHAVSDAKLLSGIRQLKHDSNETSRNPTDWQDDAATPWDLTSWFCRRMSPTPAVCGLPLASSQKHIRTTEPFDRGFYAGPCGVVSAQGSELTVALRSALVQDRRRLHVYAGAGIVQGSVPEEEYAEISLKMRQFTEGFPAEPPGGLAASLSAAPNLNTLWATLVVEELVRSGVLHFVICAGSRSTPLVVAVARSPAATFVMNHDERGAAFYALGWAKAVGGPVGVIVTSGSAVANLLPGCLEAAAAQVPLVLLTADRPPELRDTGANQTITQPNIFGRFVRWEKDFPPPSTEYPAHALLSDVDLAVGHATGSLSQNPGPVHLNFCFRENLAPDAGPVRGAPERNSSWDKHYASTHELVRWASEGKPKSVYVPSLPLMCPHGIVDELTELVSSESRIVVVVGALSNAREALLAENIAARLRGVVFACITSGLRQYPGTVHYVDQLLVSPFLAGDLLQVDAVVQLGGPVVSARIAAFVKSARPRLHVRVAPLPTRFDPDHTVTHNVTCSLEAFAGFLLEAGLDAVGCAGCFWQRLSEIAEVSIDETLSGESFTEPLVARTVTQLLHPLGRLFSSSSMPIRDMDMFARESDQGPPYPLSANRGASGIDGVINTAIGFCRGCEGPVTLLIGDVATLYDLNAFQQLSGPDAPPLTIVVQNNSGGGIFSFLPIAQHRDVFSPCFDEPHRVDFGAACGAFGLRYTCCSTLDEFTLAYSKAQGSSSSGACVIEARVALSHSENAALHKKIGQVVAARVRAAILCQVQLSWFRCGTDVDCCPLLLLHGWLGSKGDWASTSHSLTELGREVLAVDLPGHALSDVSADGPWERAALYSFPVVVESLAALLDRLNIPRVVAVGYSLGGRVAMALASAHPDRIQGLVAISANPGLKSATERYARLQGDQALACRLLGMDDGTFEVFLKKWYAAPLWAGLSSRCPDLLVDILRRRVQTNPRGAALSLVGLTVARQVDFSGSLGKIPLWYVSGGLDKKFGDIGALLSALPAHHVDVSVVSDVGHAVVEENPQAVVDLCSRVLEKLQSPPGPLPLPTSRRLASACFRPIKLMLKMPLLLSRGQPMSHRSGLLVVLQTQEDSRVCTGIGEVCPLPMFHEESLSEAEAQLQTVLSAWSADPPALPPTLAQLDGSLRRWLSEHAPRVKLLPSVHTGLEMALLHLLYRRSNAPHIGALAAGRKGYCSEVGVNGLLAREEDLDTPASDCHGATVVKVKVGKDPVEDAHRINDLAEMLHRRVGLRARLRLDANQAWDVEAAATFVRELSDLTVGITEYLEEPCHGAVNTFEELAPVWESLHVKTQGRVRFAADESLTSSLLSNPFASLKSPVSAIVLKPALQGIERTFELAHLGQQHNIQPVLSSAFESGVALSHFAILASILGLSGSSSPVSSCHGLGTFGRLAEDVLCPPFADLVHNQNGSGWYVNVLRCQEALDVTADTISES